MNKRVKKYLVLTVGGIFILLGLAGLFLPFLQGILFLIIGLLIISFYSPTLRIKVEKFTGKHPKLHSIVEKIKSLLTRIIGEP